MGDPVVELAAMFALIITTPPAPEPPVEVPDMPACHDAPPPPEPV